jgi:hypothetical protein
MLASWVILSGACAYAQIQIAVRRSPGFMSTAFAHCNDGAVPGDQCDPAGFNVPHGIGFEIEYYGWKDDVVTIYNNGYITIGQPVAAAHSTPYSLGPDARRIAPFWADVDTRSAFSGVVTYGNDVVAGHTAFAVTWDGVGYFNQHFDLRDAFQVVLIRREDTGPRDFDIEFNYDFIDWDAGDLDGGVSGHAQPGMQSAVVGFSGPPAAIFQLPGSGVAGALTDDGTSPLVFGSLGSSQVARYVFHIRSGLAVECQSDASCDDNNACTVDACQPPVIGQPGVGQCSHSPVVDGTVCDDQSACTTNDTCASGVCTGTKVTCDDGNVCTNDACDPATGCFATPASDGTPCDDSDPCSTASACSGGVCTATDRVCQIDLPAVGNNVVVQGGKVLKNVVGCEIKQGGTCAAALYEAPGSGGVAALRTLGAVSATRLSTNTKRKVGAGRTIRLSLKLNKLGRRLLQKSSPLAATVTVSVKAKGRSSVSVSKLIRLTK